MIFGFSKLPQMISFIWIVFGIIASILFVLYELKAKQPVFNVRFRPSMGIAMMAISIYPDNRIFFVTGTQI